MDNAYVVETPLSLCRFGIARRDITPPVGIYHRMWGAATHDRSEGVHRPLTLTAMVFSPRDGRQQRQVFVALDHCLLMHADMVQLSERVCSAVPLEPEQLLVTFSHTHAAGLMDTGRSDLPGGEMIAAYLEEVAARTAAAVREAIDSQRPVTITYVRGHCDLAANRDLWDAENKMFVCGFNPAQEADDALLVARVTDEADSPVATMVNYACHPTTLAWDNRLISPDFPGALRETVERTTGVPCVFLQGASGDLGPREGFVGDVNVADRNGRQLGYAVLTALESAAPSRTRFVYNGPVVSGANIGTWVREPMDEESLTGKHFWRKQRLTVDLPYRDGLPSVADTESTLTEWSSREHAASAAGNESEARDARALAERARRLLTRLSALPEGAVFPFPVTFCQFGDALWLGVEGEPYNLLQRELRRRFPKIPIMAMVLAGGWRPGYLPTSETYDKGIYQESIAVLAPGCLERLIDEVARQIENWQTE